MAEFGRLELPQRPAEFHSNESIKFGLLYEEGLITLGDGVWNWNAYSDEQKARIIPQMVARFYYQELGAPAHEWRMMFMQTLQELQYKYNPLYSAFDSGDLNPVYDSHEWERVREIGSDFPQTRLVSNPAGDYASEGRDTEREHVRIGNALEVAERYKDWRAVDTMLIDELEMRCFSCIMWAQSDAL